MQLGGMSYTDLCLCTLYFISEGKSQPKQVGKKPSLKEECSVIVVVLSTDSKASFSWRGDKEASCREMSESVFWHIAH